jgi:putative sterol carrier protein
MEYSSARQFFDQLPAAVDPVVINGYDSLIHFDLPGDTGGQFTVRVKDNRIAVSDGLNGVPQCKLVAKEEHFLAVLNKDLNPMMAVVMGKLKITNQAEMIRYAKIFGIMRWSRTCSVVLPVLTILRR